MGRDRRTGKRTRRMPAHGHGTRRPMLMARWFHGPAQKRPEPVPERRARVEVKACCVCGATTGIVCGVDGVTWLCADPDACAELAARETAGGADDMLSPLSGASPCHEWEWREEGTLVYAAQPRRVWSPPEERMGALAEEIRDDLDDVRLAHRRVASRWECLADEVAAAFIEYSRREHEVLDALEQQRAELNDLKRRWAADNPWLHRLAVYRWRAKNPGKVAASGRRQYEKRKSAARQAGEWVARCRNCDVQFCPVRTRATKHCSDACRRQHGHEAEYARLGADLGLAPVEARKAARTRKRRKSGVGPRATLTIELGTQIGYWLIVERLRSVSAAGKKRFKYRCRCRCGFERLIPTRLLIDRSVLSCRSCRHVREREQEGVSA